MFALEELQKMNTSELITIIGNYISDQEIWLNKIKELEEQNDKKSAEIEQLKKRRGIALLRNDDLDFENYELQKQVDELKEQRDVFKRLFESANTTHFSTDILIETMNSFYREQADHLAGLKIEQATKDAVKKFADLVEFHSVASMEDNVEYFTISALGLKEILRENFGVEVE